MDEMVEEFEADLVSLLEEYSELTIHELIECLHLAVAMLVAQEVDSE